MSLNVAVVMDPIARIKIAKDSTFAMLLEAQRRGHRLHYVEPGSLSAIEGRACARLAGLTVQDDPAAWYGLTTCELRPLAGMDVVLVRTDPPVDSAYLHDSILLDLARNEGVLVVNDPRGLRDLNEKLAALLFPDCCPPTVVSRDAAVLRAFIAEHGLCVLKPLDGMGGRSIFQVRDGEPVPYCLARIPQGSEFRGNLAAGGRGEGRPLSDRDRWIAERVGPELKRRGMLFVGLDVIGDYLTEVNVTSPTCIRELDLQFGLNIAGLLFDAIEARRAAA